METDYSALEGIRDLIMNTPIIQAPALDLGRDIHDHLANYAMNDIEPLRALADRLINVVR